MTNPNYDALDGWREEVGIKKSNGQTIHYEGGCEYDPMAEAVMEYERQQAERVCAEQNKQKAPKDLDLGR